MTLNTLPSDALATFKQSDRLPLPFTLSVPVPLVERRKRKRDLTV